MKIKIVNELNDTLYKGRVVDLPEDLAKKLIKREDAEVFQESKGEQPEKTEKPKTTRKNRKK